MRLGVCVHDFLDERQQRHFLLLDMPLQALTQLLAGTTKLVPAGFVEAAGSRLPRKCSNVETYRANRDVFVGQMRADRFFADRAEIGEQMLLLEGEVPLDLALHGRGKIEQQLQNDAITGVRGAMTVARDQLLKSLNERDSCLVLLMKRLADAIGEVHRRAHACSW